MKLMPCINFFSLLVAYVENGTPNKLIEILYEKPKQSHPCPMCCLPRFRPGPLFFVITRQCILQYVLVKPLMGLLAGILHALGVYHEGSFDPQHGYLYITIFMNMSVIISMYFLVLFYLVTKQELAPFSPIAKLASMKAILFFSFWQSVFIGVLSFFDVIPEIGDWKKKELATGLNDFIVCVEMFILSVVHPFVFPYEQYASADTDTSIPTSPSEVLRVIGAPVKNFKHVVDQRDIIKDIRTAYHPHSVNDAKRYQERMTGRGERDNSTSGLLASSEDSEISD